MFGTTSKKPSEPGEIIFEPKDYQTEAIKFLLSNPEGGLFLATGLGKTIVFLIVFWILKRKGLVNKALIIAKRRIIHNVWPKEIRKWGLPLTVSKVHGSEKQRRAALDKEADIYLLTYQGIDWLSRVKPSAWYKQFDVLCLDESSMIKNWNAARSRRLRTMLKYFKRRHILTASPIPRSMMDIFSQIYVLDMGDALGRIKGVFKNRFWEAVQVQTKRKSWVEWELAEGGEDRIYKAIKPLVIRFPKDVIKLPPLHRIERVVQLSSQARQTYRELEEDFITQIREGTIVAANAGVAIQKLRQLTGGAIYYGHKQYDDTDRLSRRKRWASIHDAKIEELGELIEELQGEPLLVAYEFDHERQRIQAALGDIPHIGGGTSDAEADMLIDQWNAGKLPVLLGHPDSIAHGLNLQESGWNICFFAIGWNLENHQQFIDRVYRQGQKHAVWVYLLVAEDTVDEFIIENLEAKDVNQQRLFKAIEVAITRSKEVHEWKKSKLLGKLPKPEVVIKAYLTRIHTKWVPQWSDGLEDPVMTLVSTIMVSLGGWLPKTHVSFLKEVFGKKLSEDKPIFELFKLTQKTLFSSLKLDTVDAEAPIVVRKGKSGFGYARIYISKDPTFTRSVWPHIKETEMAKSNDTASKFGGKKASGRKAPKAKVTTTKKKAAEASNRAPRSLDPKARVTRGKTEPGKGIHAIVYGCVSAAKGCTVESLCNSVAKKLSHDRAKDEGFVQGYIRGGVRRGYLNLAA